MPNTKRKFIEGEYYHITLRRIGEELLFLDESDYFRGIFSFYEFNNSEPVTIQQRRNTRRQNNNHTARGQTSSNSNNLSREKREKLLEIVAFCMMPNHIHLLVTPLVEGGVSKFMSKFGSGYPLYFKDRHKLKKTGHFFSNRFHAVHIKTDSQLRAVFVYIHTNPVSLIYPKWKEGATIDATKAFECCKSYKWSSLKDYLGEKNFPSVTNRKFIEDFFGGKQNIKKEIRGWLKYKEKMFEEHADIFIE